MRRVRPSGQRLELQPGAAGHPHLGAQSQQARRLDRLDAPEVERVADAQFVGVAAAAPQADAADHPVEQRRAPSRRCPDVA